MICLKNNMTYPLIFNGCYFPPHEIRTVDIKKTQEIETAIRRGVLTEYLIQPKPLEVEQTVKPIEPKTVKKTQSKKKVRE